MSILSFGQIYRICNHDAEWARLYEEALREAEILEKYKNFSYNRFPRNIIDQEFKRLADFQDATQTVKELMSIISERGKIIITWEGTESGIDDVGFNYSVLENNGNIWVFHTHTNDTWFSERDCIAFCEFPLIRGMYLKNRNDEIFSLIKNYRNTISGEDYIKNRDEIKRILSEKYLEKNKINILTDQNVDPAIKKDYLDECRNKVISYLETGVIR